jgi:hypothetical protein
MSVDEFSCFWGENTLRRLKKMLRTLKNPLHAVSTGLQANAAVFISDRNDQRFKPRLLKKLPSDRQPGSGESSFKAIQTEKFRLEAASHGNTAVDDRNMRRVFSWCFIASFSWFLSQFICSF